MLLLTSQSGGEALARLQENVWAWGWTACWQKNQPNRNRLAGAQRLGWAIAPKSLPFLLLQ